MNKTTFFILILIIIAFIIVLKSNREKTEIIQKQNNEIDMLKKKEEQLSNQIKQLQQNQKKLSGISEKEINSLIKSYQKDYNLRNSTTTDSFKKKLAEFQRKSEFLPDLIPIKGDFAISQKYSSAHRGLDFASPLGQPVVAAGSGVVSSVKYDRYFGHILTLDHLNGYTSKYAHLVQTAVPEKQFVKKGEIIAFVGNTGNSTSPHLHFEILFNDMHLDPDKLLNK